MKTKSQLADKFSGPSSLLYQNEPLTITTSGSGAQQTKTFTVTPDLDVPCKVDSLNFEQGEASIEEYKVIGLSGAWITDSEPGDIDLGFRVPSISEDILKLAFGADAVSAITTGTISGTGTASDGNYSGLALVLKNKKVTGTWIIVNNTKDRVMILNNTALFASIVLDSDAKGVMAVDFNGSIESDGTNPDVIFLKKKSS